MEQRQRPHRHVPGDDRVELRKGAGSLPTNFVAPVPLSSNISFNYPAFTMENLSGKLTKVRWINDLKDASGNYLPHLLPVDQTLHWANPPGVGCEDGTNRTDCMTMRLEPYTGPVPIVTHVHGAHVHPESDGYPEAWWLPAAKNIPAGYTRKGSLFDQDSRTTPLAAPPSLPMRTPSRPPPSGTMTMPSA